MSRSLFIGLAAIAGVAVAPVAMADEGAIIVSGPRVQSSEAKVGVHPTMALVSQVSVPTHDLDLRTSYGRSVLDHRVKLAAAEVCSRLDDLTPVYGLGPDRNQESAACRLEAQKSAHSQVRAARWAAG